MGAGLVNTEFAPILIKRWRELNAKDFLNQRAAIVEVVI